MFEHITINRQGMTGAPIDLGALAECLVFYAKVRIIVDPESFKYLLRCCGPEELLELFQMGTLEIEFYENQTAVATLQTSHGPLHEFKTFTSPEIRYERVARKFFDEWAGPSGRGANRLFNRFHRLVERSSFSLEILGQAQSDILDANYVPRAVRGVLSVLAPEYSVPDDFRFEIQPVLKGGSYLIRTNLDFAAVNRVFATHTNPNTATISEAYLLVHLLNSRRDLTVGSKMQSDFSLAPEMAAAVTSKLASIVAAANNGIEVAGLFQDEITDNVPRIRDIVNSGNRNFTEVVRLVERASKFKEWLKKQGPSDDIELRRAYIRDVSHVDWADSVPGKSLRFLVMSGAGVAVSFLTGTAAGLIGGIALNAADYFLVDKIMKGWKPNQFVQESLVPFLNKTRD
jgi:hypothetical protein